MFTRDDIDRLQPTSLTDLLGRVPGVQVARSGGRGGLPGIIKRDFAGHAGTMTGVYTMALCLGAALAAGATVPLSESAHQAPAYHRSPGK